jgi:Flp pilus assembly protein TadB
VANRLHRMKGMQTSSLYSRVADPDGIPHGAVALTSLGSVALAIAVLVALMTSTTALVVVGAIPLLVIALGRSAQRRRDRRSHRLEDLPRR